MPIPPRLSAYAIRLETLARAVFQRFMLDRCLIGASALSYTTIVSMVPLTAIVLVVFSGFPQFSGGRDRLLMLLVENLAPDLGKDAGEWFTTVAGHAAQSTAIGVVALIVTSILLLATVEEHMHFIFRVHAPRRWGQRVLAYWSVLTLGPILLGVALSVTGSIDRTLAGLGLWSNKHGHSAGWATWSGHLVAPVLTIGVLMLLYWAIPNRRQPWHACLVGAVVASLLLELLKFGFGIYVAQFASYSAIYGALAGIPIALLWMYIFWAVVLLGAEITACLIEVAAGLS